MCVGHNFAEGVNYHIVLHSQVQTFNCKNNKQLEGGFGMLTVMLNGEHSQMHCYPEHVSLLKSH